jgi:hypothetical protein
MLLSLYQVLHTLSSYSYVTFVTLSVFLFLGLHLDKSSVTQYRTDVKSFLCDIRHTTIASRLLTTASTQ